MSNITPLATTPRKRLCRIKDPVKYRRNVINRAWTTINTFLSDPDGDKSKQVIIATQLALKDLDMSSRKELQQIKGAQKLASNGFLVDALAKAQRLNSKIEQTSLPRIALNAGNCIMEDHRDGGVSESEYEDMNKILLPKVKGPNAGKWLNHTGKKPQLLAMDMKERYDAAKKRNSFSE